MSLSCNPIEPGLIKECVAKTLREIASVQQKAEHKFQKSDIDIVYKIFDMEVNNLSPDAWEAKELSRQTEKSIQNLIGLFHQRLLGGLPGWEDLGTGSVVDLICHERKIVAEVKNKFNTTKGDQKFKVYEGLKRSIEKYPGYTAYYVEVISRKGSRYNKPFTPSNNLTKLRAGSCEDIRVIDGASFYDLATNSEGALNFLQKNLKDIIRSLQLETEGSSVDRSRYTLRDTDYLNYIS